MAKVFWVVFAPIDPATGNPVEYLFTSRNHPQATTIQAGKQYLPYLNSYPKTEASIFTGEFTGESESKIDDLEISIGDISLLTWPNLVWDGTPVKVYKGYDTTAAWANVVQIFDGLVAASPKFDNTIAKVALKDHGENLDKDLLSLSYLGTGGIEGPAGLKGVLKPLPLGSPKGIEPTLIEAPFVVFQYCGYGEAGGVTTLWENGLSFGAKTATVAWQGSIAATYTALKNVVLTVGQWADAPTIGCFRLGGEPKSGGVITADIVGLKNVAGGYTWDRIDRVLTYLVTVAGEDARLVPANATALWTNTGQYINDYFTDQQNIRDLMQQYLKSVGGYYTYTSSGSLYFGLVRMVAAPALTLRTDGRTTPVVEDANILAVSAPFKEIKMGVDKCFKVHSANEISDALYQAYLLVAQSAADAQQAADDAQLQVDIVEASMNAIGADGVLSRVEKQVVIANKLDLDNENASLIARANTYGIVTERDNYTTYYTALGTYLATLAPAWNSTTVDTPIARATFKQKWSDAYYYRQLLLNEIAERSLWSGVYNDGGKPENNADVTLTHISSGFTNQALIATDSTAKPKLDGMIAGAGPPITLTQINGSGTTTQSGDTIRSTNGGDNSGMYGPPIRGAQRLSMDIVPGANFTVLGFHTASAGSTSNQLSWLAYNPNTGQAQMWSNGGSVFNITITTNLTGQLTAYYDNNRVHFQIGATRYGTPLTAGADLLLYPKVWAYTPNQTYTGIRHEAASLQPDINLNILDGGAGFVARTRTDLYTPIGISAGFTNQATIATDSTAKPKLDGIDKGATVGDNFLKNASFGVTGSTVDFWNLGGSFSRTTNAGSPGYYLHGTASGDLIQANNNAMMPVQGGTTIFPSAWIRSNNASNWCYFSAVFYDGTGAPTGGNISALMFAGVANAWQYRKVAAQPVPSSATQMIVSFQIVDGVGGGGFFFDIAQPRAAITEAAATYGADINVNVFDSFSGVYRVRADLYTPVGISAGFANQATIATDSTAKTRVDAALDASGYVQSRVKDGAILGTAGTETVTNILGRTSRVSTSGYQTDSRLYTANVAYSLLPALKTPPTITDTDNSGTVTINVGSMPILGDWGGTLTYSSGGIAGCAYNTRYYIYRIVANGDPSSTGTGWGASTTLDGATGTGKVYVNSFLTRANGATPPPPPPPPPGGGGQCVDAEAWVELFSGEFKRAKDLIAGDVLPCLDYETMNNTKPVAIRSIEFSVSPLLLLTTASGGLLSCTPSTPLQLQNGKTVKAPKGIGHNLFVRDHRGVEPEERWERIVGIVEDGQRMVAHVHIGGQTYPAGASQEIMLYTHNWDKP